MIASRNRRPVPGEVAGGGIQVVDNKELAWSYFQLLNEGRTEDALDLTHEEGSFWFMRMRRSQSTPEHNEFFRAHTGHIPFEFTLHNAVEEGDQVVLELAEHFELEDGYVFDAPLCVVISIREGKIFELREYSDTKAGEDLIAHMGWNPSLSLRPS
jgi:ketosteroid isomerase-like protein